MERMWNGKVDATVPTTTQCVGLRTVPLGDWFCPNCSQPVECSTGGLLNLDEDIRENIMKHCRKSPKFFALLNFWRNFGDPLLVPLFDSLDLEFALASPRREDLAIKIITRLIERGKPDPELKLTRWEIQLALIMEQRFKKYEAKKAKKTASQKRNAEVRTNGNEEGQPVEKDDPMDTSAQESDSEKDEDMWTEEGRLVVPLEETEDPVIDGVLGGVNPLDKCSFASANLASRINVLLAMCEWKLAEDPWLREAASAKDDGPSCRGEPFGWDNHGRCYFAEGMGSARVFRERRMKMGKGQYAGADAPAWGFDVPAPMEEEDRWETVAVNVNELFRLAGLFRRGKVLERSLYSFFKEELIPSVLRPDAEDAIGKDDMELKRLRQHEWEVRANKYSVLARRKSARVEAQELMMREEEDRFLQRELERMRKAEEEKKKAIQLKKRGIDPHNAVSKKEVDDKESGFGAVGRKIRTLWMDEQKWYTGKIIRFHPRSGRHTIQYDADGTKEDVNISHVKIKFLDDDVEEYEGSDVDDREYTGLEAIGRRVKTLWDEDKTWYAGRIINYRRATRAHTILYDLDGSTEDVDLSTVQVKFVKDKKEQGTTGPTGLPVGHKLLVVSDFDRCWYQAKVAGYDAGLNMHCLVMDGGYEELVNLDLVRWISAELPTGEQPKDLEEAHLVREAELLDDVDCTPGGIVVNKPSWLALKHARDRRIPERAGDKQSQSPVLTIKTVGEEEGKMSSGKIPKLIISPLKPPQLSTHHESGDMEHTSSSKEEHPQHLKEGQSAVQSKENVMEDKEMITNNTSEERSTDVNGKGNLDQGFCRAEDKANVQLNTHIAHLQDAPSHPSKKCSNANQEAAHLPAMDSKDAAAGDHSGDLCLPPGVSQPGQ